MNDRNCWFAFTLGLAAGAALALLYAPQTGEATRQQLRGNIDDAGDYLGSAGKFIKGQASRFSREAQEAIGRAHDEVISAVDIASATAETFARTAKSLV